MPDDADNHHYHPLVKALAKSLRTKCRVRPGSTIVVACSGGADSIALLRGLAMLATRRKWELELIVGHVQHHLRGEAAEQDAAVVRNLADELGLGFERRDVKPGQVPGNVEANARTMRYRALTQIALGHDAHYVATAHHADDQLETVLMRLIRGASVTGLRGIAWRKRLRTGHDADRVYAIRPMLGAHHEDAIDLLKQLGQPWQEDETNADLTRTRARLRHQVLPLLKAIRGDAAGKAVALAEHFDHLHKLVQEHTQQVPDTLDTMTREHARSLNPIVLTQALRRDLINAGVSKDRIPGHALHPVIDAVNDTTGGERTFAFAGGVTIVVDKDNLRVQKSA